jgi:hypothetical protein
MALFEDVDTTFGFPMVSVQVCWNCEYLQGHLGRYSSQGPTCGECEAKLETYQVLKQNA